MVWKSTYWIIANLDSEFPGWREKFMCEGGHPLWDRFAEVLAFMKNPTQYQIDHTGRGFFRDRPMNQEGVKFLCFSHWADRNPSAMLFAFAGAAGFGRPDKERKEIVRKAFAYANKHGYDAALKYLHRFNKVNPYAK